MRSFGLGKSSKYIKLAFPGLTAGLAAEPVPVIFISVSDIFGTLVSIDQISLLKPLTLS